VTLVALVIAPPAGTTPILLASATDAPTGAAVTPYTSSFNLGYRMFAMPYAGSARHGCGDVGVADVNRCVDAVARGGDPLTISNGGTGVTDTPVSAVVPEPARLTMMGLGFAALVARQAR
jgi:hypothetical protein